MVTKKISYLLKKGKKYIYNVSWLFLEKILRMTVGLSVGVWVARYLGPNDFGLLSYAQSFVALFTIFATLGLDSIVIKELVKGDKEVNIIMGTAFKLKLLGSLIVIIILFIAVKLTTNNEFENLLIFIISGSIVFQSFNVIDFYFQSKVLSKFVVFANTFSLLFVTAIKVVFIVYEAPLIYFAFTSILDNIIIALGLLYFYRRESKPQKRFKFENKLAAEMLRQSWPLVLSGLAVSFYMKLDQVIVKEMLGGIAVGYYAAATKVADIWIFFGSAISKSFFPAIIKSKNKNETEYLKRIQKLYQLLILLAIVLSIINAIFSDKIIIILFGNEYYKSAMILEIYVWSIVFVYLNIASWSWYVNENLQRIAFYRLILGAILNFILNIFLIREHGLEGAAMATIFSYAIASYFGNLISSKTRVNFILQTKALLHVFDLKSYFK